MSGTSTKAESKTKTKKTTKTVKTSAKKDASVAEKLDALFNLQKIDSEIDRIRIIRGELPLEVEDLENEIIGLETRTGKIQDEVDELQQDITNRKLSSKDADTAILKYKERQNNVRNNREYESLSKEIEFQDLEIKLNEKRSKEAVVKIENKRKKSNCLFREVWVSDPGTGPFGFVSKCCAVLRYLCIRKTDLDPDRTKIDLGTPLPKKSLKVCPNSAGFIQDYMTDKTMLT